MTNHVLVFGGSFNPPHIAHVLALCVAKSLAPWNRLLVVPTYLHPLGKTLAPFDARIAMCELAMGWIPGVSISRVEQELGGESRTLRTLQQLQAREPDAKLRLLIGSDILLESHKWQAFDAVCALAPPLVLGRIGAPHRDAGPELLPAISSTMVRQALARGEGDALGFVPKAVVDYAQAHGLYTE